MKLLLASLMYLGTVSHSYGHHDFTDDVNLGHLIQFGGTITGLEWAEPHVLIRIVGNPDLPNSPEWLVEIESSENLISRGIDMQTFEVPSRISIIGYPSKGQFRQGESLIYGLYLAQSPIDKVLLNEDLLNLLSTTSGLKAISVDGGGVFVSDP
ncbi:MAG: DUF6152 family protein [Pseudohongiellaceae bacterium]